MCWHCAGLCALWYFICCRSYTKSIRQWVGPTLKVLDNKILNVDMSGKALAEVEGLRERVTATDTVLDDAEGGER